jgi:hypothetical protein
MAYSGVRCGRTIRRKYCPATVRSHAAAGARIKDYNRETHDHNNYLDRRLIPGADWSVPDPDAHLPLEMPMNRTAWILAAAALLVTACADDTTDPAASIVGVYTLQTIDGHTLPYAVESEVQTGGTLQLKADSKWSVALAAHYVSGGDASFSDSGTYTYTDGDLALKSGTDGAVTHGTFSGTTLTIQGDDAIYVLKKN